MTPTPLLTAATLLLAASTAFSQTSTPSTRLLISDNGAVPDGVTLNTQSIQKSIDQLADQGGGTLVVPKGTFLTGALFLKPKVNLELEKDAVLQGSTHIDDYPSLPTRIEGHTQVWRPAILNADHCDHLRITGQGTLQGGGKPYWDAFWSRRKSNPKITNLDVDRPRNIFIRDSDDVLLSGINLRQSGFWNLHLYRCTHATVDHLDIRTPPGAPSTDGIDIDSSQNVTVQNCYLSVDDDDIALKGSKGPTADQDTDSPPVQHIHITHCTFAHGHGVVTLGSEASLVKDVLVEDSKVIDTPEAKNAANHNVLVRLKLRPDTPQHYQDITYRNITLNFTGTFISIEPWTQFFNLDGQSAPTQLVENITLENITGHTTHFGRIAGPPKSTLRNITLKNVHLQLDNPKTTIKNVENLKLENTTINDKPLELPQSEKTSE